MKPFNDNNKRINVASVISADLEALPQRYYSSQRTCPPVKEARMLNLVPGVFSAFKMAAQRPWQTADHVTLNLPITRPAADLKRSKSLIFLETHDLLFARVFSKPPF